MTFKMSDSDRIITIYNLLSDTSEFIGKADGFIPAGTGLPAHSTDIAPPDTTDGFIAVFDPLLSNWSIVEDHRGATVYDINTGQSITINKLGCLPENVVSVALGGDFFKWNGNKWVHDADAQKALFVTQARQLKGNLLSFATSNIAPLQDAVDLDIATDDEIKLLLEWKKYRVLLSRVNPSGTPDIEWPSEPV